MQPPADVCVNCGAPLTGEYCAQCGERRLERAHLKLSAFARSAVEEMTDLEHSRLIRTLQTLFFRPGALTAEYLRGRRKSFVGPIKIYLTIFALSFLLYAIYQPTAVYDVRTFARSDASGQWQTLLSRLATRHQMSEGFLIAELNSRWQRYVNLTQAIYPLGVALLLQLLYLGARRHFAEHLIFALHFSALAAAVNIVMWPVYAFVGLRLTASYAIATSLTLGLIMAWLIIACRRVYGGSWWASAIKALVIETWYFVLGLLLALATLALATFTLGRIH